MVARSQELQKNCKTAHFYGMLLQNSFISGEQKITCKEETGLARQTH
jgi:hypothetical protein